MPRTGVPAGRVAAACSAAAACAMFATPSTAERMVHPAATASHGTHGGPFVGSGQHRDVGEGAHVLAVVVGLACFVAVAVIVAIRLVVFDFDFVLALRFEASAVAEEEGAGA